MHPRVAVLALRSASEESELSAARYRDLPGNGRPRRKMAGMAHSGAEWIGMKECFRGYTQHILCASLRSFIPDAQGTRETLCWNN